MFLKRSSLLFLTLIIIGNTLWSQASKSVFLELGGNGIGISINYDARFSKKTNGFGYRVGLGILPSTFDMVSETSTLLAIPLVINYLTGTRSHHFEAGLGVTYISGSVGYFGFEKEKVAGVVLIPSVGYRYSRSKGGFLGRVVVSPLVGGGGIGFFYGLSGGLAF